MQQVRHLFNLTIRNQFMNKYILILFALTSILFFSCKDEIETIEREQSNYLPTEVGKYRIYQVDSFLLEPTFPDRNTSHLVREEVVASFDDNSGRKSYRVLRTQRKTGSSFWLPIATWYITPDGNNIEQNEDNLTFIKLVYPVKQDKKWNGNVLFENTLVENRKCSTDEFYKNWDYSYAQVNVPAIIDTMSFDSTTTVIGVDDGNLIRKRYSKEVYATNVGLIERKEYDLEYNGSTIPPANLGWPERANCGYTVSMSLVGHN